MTVGPSSLPISCSPSFGSDLAAGLASAGFAAAAGLDSAGFAAAGAEVGAAAAGFVSAGLEAAGAVVAAGAAGFVSAGLVAGAAGAQAFNSPRPAIPSAPVAPLRRKTRRVKPGFVAIRYSLTPGLTRCVLAWCSAACHIRHRGQPGSSGTWGATSTTHADHRPSQVRATLSSVVLTATSTSDECGMRQM